MPRRKHLIFITELYFWMTNGNNDGKKKSLANRAWHAIKLLDDSNYRFGLYSKQLLWRKNAHFLSRITLSRIWTLSTILRLVTLKTNKQTKLQLIPFPKLRKVTWGCSFFLVLGLRVTYITIFKKVKLLGYFSPVYKPGNEIFFAKLRFKSNSW